MATTLELATSLSLIGSYETDADLESAVSTIRNIFSEEYANGTGNNQANTWWADTVALTTSPTAYDLTSGMTDRWGNALTFTKIKLIFIYNRSTTDSEYLTVGGNFLVNLFTFTSGDTMAIFGSQSWLTQRPLTGFAISNGINDALTLTGSVSLNVDLILVGTR